MPQHRTSQVPWSELIRSLMPITRMGKWMTAVLIIWFIDWTFTEGRTLFGSGWLKRVFDVGAVVGLIPVAHFLVRGGRWVTEHLLWRLRRRLIVTYLLIGALPILLVTSLIVLVGYVVVMQSSSSLVSRQLDGYLEQSHAAALSISQDLSHLDLAGMDREQLQRRLQERANALAPIFPDLTLSLHGAASQEPPVLVRGYSSEGRSQPAAAPTPSPLRISEEGEPLPDWLRDQSEFHGLVIEEGPGADRLVRARHIIKLTKPSPAIFQLSYPIGPSMCEHLKHTTDLEVKPGQVLAPLISTPAGAQIDAAEMRELGQRGEVTAWPPGSLPIYKTTTKWSTGRQIEGDVLLIDGSFLLPSKIWQRVRQFRSESLFGNMIVLAIASLGFFFLLIALLAVGSAVWLTRSITGAVHYLYAGTKRVEAGDFDHEIPITGSNQLGELAGSFNQMTRSIRELLSVSEEKQRLDQEVRIAAEVQSRLFPRSVPRTTRLDFAPGVCIPARAVSGDYFDYLELAQGQIGIVVADVCGKGVSAALMMANLQANLRGQVQAYHDAYNFSLSLAAQSESRESKTGGRHRQHPLETTGRAHPVQRIIQQINRQLADSIIDASYITLFYAEFDEQDSTLRYTNAGHNPPILLRGNSQGERLIERLDRGGTVLGLFHESEYEEGELKFNSGDILVAFTDGLIEARNLSDEEYGEERVIRTIIDNAHLPATEIERRILQSLREWTANTEQEDDLTLILFKGR
ncbi:MAG TPA: SpoIIE family protein phosphatase [Blastocatellia bacterium]|nr:SpoIIE family protein phosphatase [Blastocatellia bacterium]